jgi:glucose/arabinose dehydrogenase
MPPNRSLSARLHTWRGAALAVALVVAGLSLLLPGSSPRAADEKNAPLPSPPSDEGEGKVRGKPPTQYECRWADGPITLDRKADEAAWKNAQVIDHFYLPWLGKNARKARTATKARLLWDREYLYFHAEMEDSDLYADVKEHDGPTWDNDVFELFLKPADDKPGYYEFEVNAAGTVLDMFLPRRGAGGYRRFKSDGEFHVEAKVKLDGTLNDWTDKDRGWSVEGRIPWRDFLRTGGRPEPGEKWKFALCRYDYSVDFEGPELSTCAPLKSLTYPDFHHHEDYTTLHFIGPDGKGTAKDVGIDKRVALTTSKVVGSPDPPPPYRVERVFPKLNLNYPIYVNHQPGSDRLLMITQKWSYGPAFLQRVKDDPNASEVETLISFDGVAYHFTFHPDFKNNGYLYVGWNGPLTGAGTKMTRVTRYTMETKPPYRLDPKSAKTIIEWPSDGHNGGAVAFGHDGMLYVTSGDGTSDSDTHIVGQDLTKLTAKVLRIDVDHPDKARAYSVPKDNPFVGTRDARPETWAYGLRNPWRITVDAKTGHVWVGQNGQDLWEQAYLVKKGENYGWSVYEGSHPFYPNRKLGPTPVVKPTVEHHHSEFRSLTGGIVYYGDKYPELRGAYLYGDYSTGKIWGVKHDGKKVVWNKELADSHLQVTGFGVDSKGEVLICDHRGNGKGALYTLTPTPKDLPLSTFPRKLSESGLFRSVKEHKMEPAMIPYSVNAPLWSDGAFKERWLGLPGDDPKLDFTTWRGWNFPDRTVIVKSFALEAEEGKPRSRRWIETRFLTKQDGEWYGYSYLWNDEQTDATLVGAGGADKEYTIRVPKSKEHPDGVRKQTWHYPSRAECMVCHSRAANFVLGLTELQMNKVHDYGGVKANQLRTLEHLGVLRVNAAEEMKNAMREECKAKGMTDKQINDYMHRQTATRMQREAKPSSLLTFPPEKYRHLPDPYDRKADLSLRARAYLHSNCAQCHVEAGGGNAAFSVEFDAAADRMKLFDEKPKHDTFGLPDARLIAPGRPDSSVLLYRMAHRKAGHMPPLATALVDDEAVRLLREWIREMKPLPKEPLRK